MTGSQIHRADDRLLRIVTQTIAGAPPKAKWSVVTSGASILFVVVVVVIDTLNGTSVAEASRMAALVIGILGIVLLSVALVINNVGQSATAAACGRMSSFRLEARVSTASCWRSP